MNINSQKNLFKICLVNAGNGVANLSMNSYFIVKAYAKKLKELEEMSKELTVDEIVDTPIIDFTRPEEYNELKEIEVAIFNNNAYWVKNNHMYMAKINEYGDIDIKTTKEIDVFSLNKKELEALIKIVDTLN